MDVRLGEAGRVKRRWGRVVIGTIAVLLVLSAIPVSLVGATFIGLRPLEPRTFGADSILKDGFVSIGVIDEGGGALALIDAGNDAQGKVLLAELARRHLAPAAVHDIFLTHGHHDHTAGVALFPQAVVHLGAGDAALAAGKEHAKGPLTRFFPPADLGIKNPDLISADGPIQAGTKIVQAFLIPGHTAGSMAYLVDGLLFLGDSAGCQKDGDLRPAPWPMTDDQAQSKQSLRRLAGALQSSHAEVAELVCAHSGALEGVQPLYTFASKLGE